MLSHHCVLYTQVTGQHQDGVVNAIDVAALIAVACVNTGTDEAMAQIVACTDSGVNVGSIAGVARPTGSPCRPDL